MFLGLPGRTASTTTLSVTMPFDGPLFQSEATMLALTRRSMSGESENATKSAGKPAATARLWSPLAP